MAMLVSKIELEIEVKVPCRAALIVGDIVLKLFGRKTHGVVPIFLSQTTRELSRLPTSKKSKINSK
jgi:hypothetical protein